MRHFTPKLSGSTTVSGSFTSDTHLIPEDNGVYDIGSASMGWRNLYGTASVAISASFATTSTSASYASTVEYDNITNVPEGIVSSSTQVINHLPDGTVSSSVQIDYTNITNVPGDIVSSSTQVINNLPDGTVSGSSQINYTNVTNIPLGIISSSTQINNLISDGGVLPDGTLSSSAQIASDISGALSAVAIAELGANILSGSITTSSITNFDTHVSSAAASAGFGTGGGGGSYTLTNTDIAGLGVSIVSSSAQTTANLPAGIISGSSQVDFGVANGVVPSGDGAGGFNNSGIATATNVIYIGKDRLAFGASQDGEGAIDAGARASLDPNRLTLAAVTNESSTNGIRITDSSTAGASTLTISSEDGVQITGSVDINSTLGIPGFPNVSASLAAISSSAADGGGGSYTLTNTDIAGLGVGIVSSSAQTTANLPGGLVSGSSQISYTNITNVPSNIISSSTQVETIINNNNVLPDGTISSSAQISGLGFSSGSGGSGGFYVHTQSSAAVEWTVNHSLGEQFPNVTVYDENYEVIIPEEISASNSNNLVITLPTAETGWVAVGNGGSGGGGSYTLTNTDIAGLGVGIISGSSQLPDGIHSSSAQVVASLDNQHVDFGTGNITASNLAIGGGGGGIDPAYIRHTNNPDTYITIQDNVNFFPPGTHCMVHNLDGVEFLRFQKPDGGTTNLRARFNNNCCSNFGFEVRGNSTRPYALCVKNGYVGVNTDNPTYELTIAGTASADVFRGDGAAITGIISASHAVTASYAPSSYVLPDGVVSGSDQIVPLLPDGTISGSTQVSFTNITNVPDGIVSGSSQIENLSFTSSYAETAESASVVENVSASNADYLRMWVGSKTDYDSISGSADDNTLYFLT